MAAPMTEQGFRNLHSQIAEFDKVEWIYEATREIVERFCRTSFAIHDGQRRATLLGAQHSSCPSNRATRSPFARGPRDHCPRKLRKLPSQQILPPRWMVRYQNPLR